MKNKNKIYTILSAFILLSLFLVVFLIWPLFKEIKKNSDDLILARSSIANLQTQINETNNFKKDYETYKADFIKIDQLFIDPNSPVDFIEFLENTASDYKITSQISLPPSSPLNSKQFILLQFASKGGFSDVLSFIKKIESGPYLIEIENLSIQDAPQNISGSQNNILNITDNSSSRNVEATFIIKVFIKK